MDSWFFTPSERQRSCQGDSIVIKTPEVKLKVSCKQIKPLSPRRTTRTTRTTTKTTLTTHNYERRTTATTCFFFQWRKDNNMLHLIRELNMYYMNTHLFFLFNTVVLMSFHEIHLWSIHTLVSLAVASPSKLAGYGKMYIPRVSEFAVTHSNPLNNLCLLIEREHAVCEEIRIPLDLPAVGYCGCRN